MLKYGSMLNKLGIASYNEQQNAFLLSLGTLKKRRRSKRSNVFFQYFVVAADSSNPLFRNIGCFAFMLTRFYIPAVIMGRSLAVRQARI